MIKFATKFFCVRVKTIMVELDAKVLYKFPASSIKKYKAMIELLSCEMNWEYFKKFIDTVYALFIDSVVSSRRSKKIIVSVQNNDEHWCTIKKDFLRLNVQ